MATNPLLNYVRGWVESDTPPPRFAVSEGHETSGWWPANRTRRRVSRNLDAVKGFMTSHPYRLVAETVTDRILPTGGRAISTELRYERYGYESNDRWVRVKP